MAATLRDIARVGQLIAEDGKGIVPSQWLHDIVNKGDREAFAKGNWSAGLNRFWNKVEPIIHRVVLVLEAFSARVQDITKAWEHICSVKVPILLQQFSKDLFVGDLAISTAEWLSHSTQAVQASESRVVLPCVTYRSFFTEDLWSSARTSISPTNESIPRRPLKRGQ